ncbi:MAG: Crp/Fnr family transcriptional regulator [Flavobacteriales bacterium]
MKKGQALLSSGQVCKSIYFVERGYLRSSYIKDGREVNTAFTFEGGFATDLKSLRTSSPAELMIQAGEPVEIHEFGKEALLQLYAVSPEIATFGRNVLEQILLEQEEHSNTFKLCSPTERYHALLAGRPEMLRRVPLTQIASYLGIARETLSRIRGR